MMLSLHDSRGVTFAFIYNFRLPFAYVSHYKSVLFELNFAIIVVITDHDLELVEKCVIFIRNLKLLLYVIRDIF